MKKLIIYLLFLIFLSACQATREGFTLKKKENSDEFLVEKKNPLVLPPEFSELPQPGNTNISNENEDESFESKILSNENSDQVDSSVTGTNSTEDFILKNIKKNETK